MNMWVIKKERTVGHAIHVYARIEFKTLGHNDRHKEEDPMREKVIEQKLVQAVKKVGGLAIKFTSPGLSGMPDRLVILPMNYMAFVEVKAPGGKPRPLQVKRHELLKRLGCRVFVLDDEGKISELMSAMLEEVMPHEVHTARISKVRD